MSCSRKCLVLEFNAGRIKETCGLDTARRLPTTSLNRYGPDRTMVLSFYLSTRYNEDTIYLLSIDHGSVIYQTLNKKKKN
jgi:hypothetical protein